MKNIIIILAAVFLFSNNLFSQNVAEPEFVGETILLGADDSAIPLEKSQAQIKTNANAGAYIVGIGSIKTRLTVKKCCASVRVNQAEQIQLIVRSYDNYTDPLAVVTVFQFESKKKERRAELESESTFFGGTSSNNMTILPFSAKKFGESSYLLTLDNVQPGEYGVLVNTIDQRSTIVSCFGIDSNITE
ncbi:MAG: hypothetical protein LBV71_19735 [Prevotella sp.]|jgi:hypothetical protein|nr:hypothetical protein [Prevotella sp.]